MSYRIGQREREWQGQVVELNLDHSSRTYGRPLTVNEILESWRGRAPTWDLGSGGVGGDPSDDIDDVDTETPAAFDAVNLYEFYRSIRSLRAKLKGLEQNTDILRAHLVGRSDSVTALAHLADRDEEAPIVRYLVLREMCGVISWKCLLDEDLVARVRQMASEARDRTYAQLLDEHGDEKKAADMLEWFEKELVGLDSGVDA